VAYAFADDLLSPNDSGEDQAPTVQPTSAGRRRPKPLLIKLPTLRDEAEYVANKVTEANRTGMPWNEMAVVYRRYGIGQQIADALSRKKIPFQWQQDKKQSYSPTHDSVKLITMHSSKGLEFPLVCIPAIGAPSKEEDDAQDEARLLYVAMTRATRELIMTHGEGSVCGEKMEKAMEVLQAL
jgi:superfamily I DNA/RNA helicase